MKNNRDKLSPETQHILEERRNDVLNQIMLVCSGESFHLEECREIRKLIRAHRRHTLPN